jgi:crotonobetainyl-CoA:carnitine CoA-transferase CaiB-like acyl-CoA transferase
VDAAADAMGQLSHIKVLDLSRVLAGPWAGQILADLGAEVIKVERPGVGDDTRGWGPPFLRGNDGVDTAEAGYYLAVNRGKRSVTVSLDKPEGQAIIRQLAASSDVVIENFKAGTLARYGLGYPDLKAVNPKLIYCSVTGFGQTGPRRDQAAYDFMIQAMGGLMSVTGERDDKPGGGPQKVGLPIVDLMSGMYASVAILAALSHRDETGLGGYIDIAMLDVLVATLSNQAMNYLISGVAPKRTGNAHPNIQPQDVFSCKDGDIAIAVGNDGQFVKFCDALGLTDLAHHADFEKNAARVKNLARLRPLIAARLREKDRHEWVTALDKAGVPASPINTIPEVFADEQVKFRGLLTEVPHPLGGTVPQVGSPMRFSENGVGERRAPPRLGEHTIEVLHELGIRDEKLDELKRLGVI